MADRYQTLENGKEKIVEATSVSTGVAEAGDIVALDSTGKIDVSLLPTGIGADVAVIEAAVDIPAGRYVNIFDDGGVTKVRLADNSNARDAHGFVKEAVLTGNNATVYFEGSNDALTGLTPGARQYLGLNGAATETPLDPTDPLNVNKIHQFLGVAIGNTAINTDIDDCILIG